MTRKRSAFGQALGFAPSALALGAARLLPYPARIAFGGRLGRRLMALPRFRCRAEANLAYVMPELDAEARAAIVREVGDTFGRTFFETFSLAEFQTRGMWTGPTGPGAAPLEAAAREGHGAVLVSGHFGQWEAGRAWLKSIGSEAGAVYRPLNNRPLEQIYRRQLEIGGRPMFPKGGRGLRGLVAHLAQGRIAAILTDQYDRRAAIFDFLGRPAPTLTLAADLALKFGVPLIPGYGLRAADGLHVSLDLEAPVPHTTAAEMTQALNDSLAARVRAHPGQYLWLHRRWRKDLPAPAA
ncbi:MAG: lauroyl acyltransferase [Rhodobacteraceae bacterium]|nr:lauroyl acyltransferase [Paracoccaceae bacterium]